MKFTPLSETTSTPIFFIFESPPGVFRKRRTSREMALDAPWVVSFKCVVKGYQDCRFDVKEGEDQSCKENKRAGATGKAVLFEL